MIYRGLVAATVAAGLGLLLAYGVHVATAPNMVMVPGETPQVETPAHAIRAGVPYVQQDGSVRQVCISNRDAMTMPPFVEGP